MVNVSSQAPTSPVVPYRTLFIKATSTAGADVMVQRLSDSESHGKASTHIKEHPAEIVADYSIKVEVA